MPVTALASGAWFLWVFGCALVAAAASAGVLVHLNEERLDRQRNGKPAGRVPLLKLHTFLTRVAGGTGVLGLGLGMLLHAAGVPSSHQAWLAIAASFAAWVAAWLCFASAEAGSWPF